MYPFMLEYLPVGENRPYVTIHRNVLRDGKYDSVPESNGYRSLAFFPPEATASKKYLKMCERIHDLNFEEARALAQSVASSF